MKRCPKCNRTYSTDTQKFCTHDGGLLFAIDAGLGETVQFDSSKVRDAVAKPTTRDLTEQEPSAFDPEATVVSSVEDGTQQITTRDTGSLEPSQPTQYQTPPPAEASSESLPSLTSTPPTESVSGSIATSAPLPPAEPTPPGPIAPPAPLPAQAQPSQPLAAPAAKKKSKLPLVLAIVAVLLIFFVGAAAVAAYFLVIKPRQEARPTVSSIPSEPTRTNPSAPTTATPAAAQPANEPPPYSAPADAVQFVNSRDNLDGKLLEHYVDFSFYYPNAWVKDPTAGVTGASNFAKVERRIPPDFTQENFAVGWFAYSSSGSAGGDRALYHDLSENLSAKLALGFPEYRKVSEGPTRAGAYDGYEFRFEAMSRGTAKGDIKIWGRVIFITPPNGGDTGVTLLMLATSLAPELESVDDIGAKGELPMLLESFRFGKS
jgi:hypothetical protein